MHPFNYFKKQVFVLAGICVVSLLFVFSNGLNALELIVQQKRFLAQIPGVSRAELAELRGRYVDRDAIRFFGIDMVSHWQTEDRQIHTTQLSLLLNFKDDDKMQPEPVIQLSVSNGIAVDTEYGGYQHESPEDRAIHNISGSVQSVQITGNGNDVSNQIDILLTEGPAENASAISNAHGVQLIDQGNMRFESEEGAVADITFTNQSLEYSFRMPDRGEIRQSISRQGLLQSTRLNSNNNAIENQIQLRVHQAQSRQIRIDGPGSALQQLQGLYTTGRF